MNPSSVATSDGSLLAMAGNAVSLLGAAGLTSERLGLMVISVLALIACVTVHEFGHALVADRLGDPLPRQQGRVTLNPLAHIDWLGTVLFPALMAMGAGLPLAWGKPVEWTGNPRYLTRRFSMRTIRLMVSTAGPGMNLALALLTSILYIVGRRLHIDPLAKLGGLLVPMNLSLMCFNLLPIPPLDGRSFLEFLPEALAPIRDFLLRYGSFVFLALVLLGTGSGFSPLGWLMSPFWWLIDQYLGLLAKIAH
jgi:Zn-dependent protease